MSFLMEDCLEQVSFDGIQASAHSCTIQETETKNIVFHLPEKRRILSTRDGFLSVRTVGENICPHSLWNYVHKQAAEFRKTVLASLGEARQSCAFLFTGADPRQWALEFKYQEVMVFLTVDTRTNAMRTGLDSPKRSRSKSPGTINIFVFTLDDLSDAAMMRSIITVTEAKCATLQQNDIRSSYNESHLATGTGTDNIIIVPGKGKKVNLLRGHSPLSLAIGEAVYTAMNTAIEAGINKE